MGSTTGLGFGSGPRPARGSAPKAEWVSARAVLALLLRATVERVVCVARLVGVVWFGPLLRPLGSQDKLCKLENFGWSVSRPTVTRVTRDLPDCKEP